MVDVSRVRARLVPRHERAVEADGRVVAPLCGGGILEEGDRDRAFDGRGRGGDDQRPARPELERVREEREHVRAGRFQARKLRPDVGRAGLGGLGRDDPGLRAHEPLLQAGQQLAAGVVVLNEHGDPRTRLRSGEVLAVDPALGLVARAEADRPGVPRVVAAKGGRAGRDEELRHSLRVQVAAGRQILLGPRRVDDREGPVLLDEPARLLQCSRRVVAVVRDPVLDPPAVDTSPGVHVPEVGVGPTHLRRIRRRRAQEDPRAGDSGIGAGRRGRARRDRTGEQEHGGGQPGSQRTRW